MQVVDKIFADFYALMPPDNAATVAHGTDVSFPGGTQPVSAHLMILQLRQIIIKQFRV